jgi:aryl-alcohol dehydrogenase-like predicted oxidoreductase
MEFATIPETSLIVSRVGLGTWAIGGWMWGGTDEQESLKTIQAAVEHGINLIDTAPAYGFGRSEEIVGRAIAEGQLRSRVVIATKAGLHWKDGKVFRYGSRDRILHEVSDSMRRLRTDYIDIYQVHWPDPLVPIEETAEAMQALFDEWKIQAIGVSNFSVPQIERFRRVAKLHVVQPPYNLFEREIEPELLPYCLDLWGTVPRPPVRQAARRHAFCGRRSAINGPEIPAASLRAIPCCGSPSRSVRPATLWQARHPFGGALAPRSGCDCGIVGSAPSRPTPAHRRGVRLVA